MARPRSNPEELLPLMQIIAPRVRAVRNARGLIQAEVADRAGVSEEFYARIERGVALPSVRKFCRLVIILDVSADALLGLAEMPKFEPAVCNTPRRSTRETRRKHLFRLLRSARPTTLHMVAWVLRELDRAARPPRETA